MAEELRRALDLMSKGAGRHRDYKGKLRRQIVELRYGLVDGRQRYPREIAKIVGLHENYVKQLEQSARDDLRKLIRVH